MALFHQKKALFKAVSISQSVSGDWTMTGQGQDPLQPVQAFYCILDSRGHALERPGCAFLGLGSASRAGRLEA